MFGGHLRGRGSVALALAAAALARSCAAEHPPAAAVESELRSCAGAAALAADSALLQARKPSLALAQAWSCPAFDQWPDVDGGVTCGNCTALVQTAPYGGRCDRYCQSFGQTCVAAAEERAENCEVLYEARCDAEIASTSDMLCSCSSRHSPGPPASGACWGQLPGLAAQEGEGVGAVVRSASADECRARCEAQAGCQSASLCPQWNSCYLKRKAFVGGEPTVSRGECRTLYKKPAASCAVQPAPAPAPPTGAGGRIKVVSYNLFWWNAFGINRATAGEDIMRNIRDVLRPEVLGAQECDEPLLIQQRTGYRPASPFRGGQGTFVEDDLFAVGEAGSRDLQARGRWGPRYATWAKLTHRPSGRSFWHFNTHWCVHSGNGYTCTSETRYAGARNMLDLIREKAGQRGHSVRDPVVITGDFNAFDGYINEASLQNFVANGFSLAKSAYVDFIFFSTPHFRVVGSGVGSNAGSDHAPVIAELEFL